MKTASKAGIGSLAAVLLAVPVVALYEGEMLTTYADPVGIPTVCYGETDKALTMRGRFSRDECRAVLGASLMAHALELDKCLTRELKPHEAAAILSWGYNVGAGAACKSTLVRKANAGEPFCAELSRWTYAGGKQLPGLVKRRAAERAMCERKG